MNQPNFNMKRWTNKYAFKNVIQMLKFYPAYFTKGLFISNPSNPLFLKQMTLFHPEPAKNIINLTMNFVLFSGKNSFITWCVI